MSDITSKTEISILVNVDGVSKVRARWERSALPGKNNIGASSEKQSIILLPWYVWHVCARHVFVVYRVKGF